ncbi:MarR family transcriptional regulator [Paenibacillus qinlingensis]|uniref:DNA-binding MarR family transcriptional regulator n=1 Tax=Paenibacillus qinlingensis TaxID=1837343 RepID=A0ABU1NU44_9BACL|nr:MarR family transcriptional regulator [Paenibacillus qinlingensis]MDR6551005.1 DNA-binding MarR family transcriptional regulator [Paenibacillus qinlingensis]
MKEREEYKVEDMLCFTIYATSRELTRIYRPTLEKFGLTYPQYLVMVVLWETRESTVTALGDRLLLDSGTLTPLLKRLQEAELIVRKRSVEDERKVEIGLTEKGAILQEQMKHVSVEIFAEICGTAEKYMQSLEQLKNLLEKANEIARRSE